MISIHEAARRMQHVHDWHLEVFPGYVCLSVEACAQEANGIGADTTPEWLRDALGVILPYAREPAFLHDLEGCFANDGTHAGFVAWNARFQRNIKRTIRQHVPAWRVASRLALYRTADACHLAVSSPIGWDAWQRAYKRAQEQIEPGPERMEGNA